MNTIACRRGTRGTSRRALAAACHCVEAVERRMLLSLAPAGGEFLVNSLTTNGQTNNALGGEQAARG